VGLNNVLLISELPADFYTLTAALERAQPERFQTRTVNTSEQPVDALLDPDNDAIILAYTMETEYLLRLAQKKQLLTPIIVMLDQSAEVQIDKLKQAGAIDYVVRGLINDDMLHRILDYAIALKEARQEQRLLLREQERLRDAASAARAQVAVAGDVASQPATALQAEPQAFSATAPSGQQQRVAPAITRAVAPERPAPSVPQDLQPQPQRYASGLWPLLGATAAFILLTLGIVLLNQRLLDDARMAQLEANSNLLIAEFAALKTELAATEQQLSTALQQPGANTALAAPPAPSPTPAPGTATNTTTPEPAPTAQLTPPSPAAAVTVTITPPPPPSRAEPTEQANPEPLITDPGTLPTLSAAERSNRSTDNVTTEVDPAQAWFINLGSFSREASARSVAARTADLPWPSEISEITSGERSLYRVRLVNLPSQAVARETAAAYRREYGGDVPWVGRN
jgi:AmiR/NasT family two-component response regulator